MSYLERLKNGEDARVLLLEASKKIEKALSIISDFDELYYTEKDDALETLEEVSQALQNGDI